MISWVPSGRPRDGTDVSHNLFLGGYCARLIENSLHWVLDVCFREDDQRHWAGNSAMNLARLRKLALCLLKAEKTSKGKSIATRRPVAGWKNDYLLRVLAQIESGARQPGFGANRGGEFTVIS
jgi:hypothetical protein